MRDHCPQKHTCWEQELELLVLTVLFGPAFNLAEAVMFVGVDVDLLPEHSPPQSHLIQPSEGFDQLGAFAVGRVAV